MSAMRRADRCCNRQNESMKVVLRNPVREMVFDRPMTVRALLDQLELNREAHLVICNGELVPGDRMLGSDAVVEVRSVISGGVA